MTTERDPWKKLAADARCASRESGDETVPYGLDTRVIAAWKNESAEPVGLERFGWGALVSAVVAAALCVALNLDDLRSLRADDMDVATVGVLERIL